MEYDAKYESIPDDDSMIADILAEMKKNFRSGLTRDLDFRVNQLKKLRDAIYANKELIHQACFKDHHRETFQTHAAEVGGVCGEIDHVAKHLKEWSKEVVVDTPIFMGPAKSVVLPEPLGVVCILGTWNFPFLLTFSQLSNAIGAGNSALIKPSEIAPHCSAVVAKIISENLDQRFYRVIEGKSKVAITLNKSKFDLFVFTGSTQKGKLVAEAAARNLVPCILELGGKSPAIIDKDADISFSAKKVLVGKLANYGQVCIAPDYLLCHESKVDEFMKELAAQYQHGYNCNDNMESGKIINSFHYKRLCGLLEDHGGEVIFGNGEAYKDYKLDLTVIKNPRYDSAIMQDEIFGPLLPLITFREFDEVIDFINDNEKPLAIYYFGKHNGDNQKRVITETSSGGFASHEVIMQAASPFLPFGGVGHSGQGRYHGYEGFKAFSNMKSLLIKKGYDKFPYNMSFPPMTDAQKEQAIGIIDKGIITQAAFCKMASIFIAIILIIVLLIVFRGAIFQ